MQIATGGLSGGVALINCTVYNFSERASLALWHYAGGISSALAGGNFWQGTKNGLIVTGLNHFGNHAYKKFYKSWFLKQVEEYYVLDAPADANASYVIEMMKKVPELKRLLKRVHKFEKSIKITAVNKRGRTTVEDEKVINVVYAATHENGDITFYKDAFYSNEILALNIGHELTHSYHHVSGMYNKWLNKARKKLHPKFVEYGSHVSYAHNMSEFYAYSWNASTTGSLFLANDAAYYHWQLAFQACRKCFDGK